MNGKNRMIAMFVLLLMGLLIVAVGELTFNQFTNSMSRSAINNCSAVMTTTSTYFSIMPVVFVTIVVTSVLAFSYYILTNVDNYILYNKKIKWIMDFLYKSAIYFCWGTGFILLIGTPSVM